MSVSECLLELRTGLYHPANVIVFIAGNRDTESATLYHPRVKTHRPTLVARYWQDDKEGDSLLMTTRRGFTSFFNWVFLIAHNEPQIMYKH